MLTNVNYNLKIATIFNINTSILLIHLIESRKESDIEMTQSREEIFKKTALDEASQIEAEFILIKSGLISVREVKNSKAKYYCKVNTDILNKVLFSDNIKDVLDADNIKQLVRVNKPKLDKKDILKNNLKKKVKDPDPVIQTYYIKWIDSVYENPKGYLTSGAVELAQKELSVFSKGDQKIKIDVLNIAIKGGWRDITWAINRYKEDKVQTKAPVYFNDYNTIKSSEDNIGGEEY